MGQRDLVYDPRVSLSRAGALGAISGIAATALFGWRGHRTATAADGSAPAGACTLTPSEDEGPYFVDVRLYRSNLTTGTNRPSVVEGVPLALTLAVTSAIAGMCAPLAGAHVDVWHADANGVYSDASDQDTIGETFLRGYQITDENGIARFRTIYPGWYHGHAVHLHVKVRTFSLAGSTAHQFTSQLFLDDAVSDAVLGGAPYNARGRRDTYNTGDPQFKPALVLPLQRSGRALAGNFNLGLRMT